MRLSSPSAEVTMSTSASGSRSQIRASMFAKAIFVVTNVLTEIFASSALTKFMRATGAPFSTVRA